MLHADAERIYLTSVQGNLFVLAQDRGSNFPLLQIISDRGFMSGVTGDTDNLYVTIDGDLRDVGPICQRDGGRLSMARHSKKSARVDGSGTFVAPTPLFKAVVLKRGRAVARNVAAWTRLECEGAEVAFREHWGGFVEIVCGDSRVMLCHCGVERLTRLPPESALAFLMKLLKAARAEQRNRVQVDLLSAVIERSIQSGRRTAPRQ
jgi:hypothetical protein